MSKNRKVFNIFSTDTLASILKNNIKFKEDDKCMCCGVPDSCYAGFCPTCLHEEIVERVIEGHIDDGKFHDHILAHGEDPVRCDKCGKTYREIVSGKKYESCTAPKG